MTLSAELPTLSLMWVERRDVVDVADNLNARSVQPHYVLAPCDARGTLYCGAGGRHRMNNVTLVTQPRRAPSPSPCRERHGRRQRVVVRGDGSRVQVCIACGAKVAELTTHLLLSKNRHGPSAIIPVRRDYRSLRLREITATLAAGVETPPLHLVDDARGEACEADSGSAA